MSRDKLITKMRLIADAFELTRADTRQVQADICRARGVSLDLKAGALLKSYLVDLSRVGKLNLADMIGSFRSPWVEMWLESSDEMDGKVRTTALHVIQEGDSMIARVWGPGKGPMIFSPPFTQVVVNQVTRTLHQSLTPFGEAAELRRGLFRHLDPKLEETARHEEKCANGLLMLASAMTAIMNTPSDILRLPEEVPPSRIWRQRYRDAGAPPARSGVGRIDLSAMGHQEYRHRVLGESDIGLEDDQSKGARRAHHVRGHMFLARNGQMTYRRPHIRGAGEVMRSMMNVTASSPEPEF